MPQLDIFQQIRTQFERSPPPTVAKRHGKVLARNQASFVTELPDKWRVDYERRNGQRHSGYFAYSHIPYRSFGNLKYTDGHDLLADHLGVTFTRHHKAYNLSHFRIHEDDGVTMASPQHTIKAVRSKSQRKPLPHSRNAGLSALRLTLGANGHSIQEMKARSCLTDTFRREEERITFLQEIRAPKPIKTDEKTGPGNAPHQLHNPSVYLSPMVRTASSKACLTLTDIFHKKPPTNIKPERTPRLVGQGTKDGHHGENETGTASTGDEKSIAAVDGDRGVGPNLYVALAAAHFKLHHAGHTKNQMSEMLVKQKRQCLAKLRCVHSILCCLHNIKMRELRGRETLSAATIRTIAQRPLRDHLHHDTHHHLHHHHHHHHHHPHTKFGTPTSTTHRHAKTHLREQPLESWEDLLALDQPHPLPLHSATNVHHHHQHYLGNHKPHRTIPPWQRKVVYVEEEDQNVRNDPQKQVHDCIEAFQYAKNLMAQKLKDTLSERKQQLLKQLVVKLQGLSLGVNMEDCLEVMRESAYQASLEERAEEENKPAWFAQLEKEAGAVFDTRAKEVREVLDKLKQFLTVDNDAIPHVTEKLCLLVMSLPANQLCYQPVIAAIQFVLQHILKVPPNLCSQWLTIRQLPQVTTELTGPAYVFGRPI